MRVMLINPKVPVYLRVPSLPLGLISIGSYLRAKGVEVMFIERSAQNVNFRQKILEFKPQLIGISCISYQSNLDAKKITKEIREVSNAPIVWGGQAPSSMPEMYLKECRPDFLSLGEGEITIYELVQAIESGKDVSQVKGLAFLDENDKIVFTPEREVADLTAFPQLDWSLVEPERYFSSFFNCTKMLYLHASKGCPASCTFCANRQFHQGKNRSRAPKHVMYDLEYLVGECGANGIYFSDEQFIPNRKIRNELLTMIIQSNLDFVWGCQMRLGVLNKEDIDFMYQAGCRWILFGIESGSQETIQKIKKGTDLNLAKPTIDYCEKKGITVQASFIIGFPEETAEEIKKTVKMALELNASLPVLNILTPLPNSEIYTKYIIGSEEIEEPKNLRELSKMEETMIDTVKYNLSNVSIKELRVLHFYFQWQDFISKDSVNNDSFGIVKKMALDTFDRIFKHGISGFIFGTFKSVKQFCTVFFYSHFFTKVLKEYGIK